MTTASGSAPPSRLEDAGLNASAVAQQRWLDGWLMRFSPGKAKRSRCINALAEGRLALDEKLRLGAAAYREAGLPMVVRITPFSCPPTLDEALAVRGFARLDDTRVMVCAGLDAAERRPPLPAGLRWQALGPAAFAEAVGRLRGSPPAQSAAHAERLAQSPVPYSGVVLERDDGGAPLACGQVAIEAELAGLYDVFTAQAERGRGFAGALCAHLLDLAARRGARMAYLQVESDNGPARAVYRRLGFADAYGYHYRTPDGAGG